MLHLHKFIDTFLALYYTVLGFIRRVVLLRCLHSVYLISFTTFLQINLIAPPLFVVTTQTLERTEGLAKLTAAIGRIKEAIEESDGVFNIKMAVSSNQTQHHSDTL